MKKLKQAATIKELSSYKYGFNDGQIGVYHTKLGIDEAVVNEISAIKNEPDWMTSLRLDSYRKFSKMKNPKWGPDLEFINYDEYTYYVRPTDHQVTSWNDVPDKIKNTFDKLGLPQAEREYLSGIKAQYDSEPVYGNMIKEATDKGVIFVDCDTALREYPELFAKYFGKLVANDDNKFAALNGAVWSGGSFIYVPPNVKLDKPLQAYFRINYQTAGQFERTLIIVDEGAELSYIEGCTAPVYSKNSLHAAVVEIFVHKNAKMRYTTIQNWSDNVINLVTKRARVDENAAMEWIDGNIGAKVNMKYPACILAGANATGSTVSIAVAKNGVQQDAGAKMIHLAKNTKSKIISKSMTFDGGLANYRGLVYIGPDAINAKSHVECDTLILDGKSHSDTIPTNKVLNNQSQIEHEATVSKISEEQLFYLMSRGVTQAQAIEMIVMGFLEPFTRELPMEYAVELNQLIKMDMIGSVG